MRPIHYRHMYVANFPTQNCFENSIISVGHFVPSDVLSLGRLVPGTFCPLVRFVPGTLCLGTILSWDVFSLGTLGCFVCAPNFRPFSFIGLNFFSHRACNSVLSHICIQQILPNFFIFQTYRSREMILGPI